MTEATVKHATIVLERRFSAPAARIFAAWTDPAIRKQWDVPEEGWETTEIDQDFRVGGHERIRFGPKGDPIYFSDGRYLDIVPNVRIVSAGAMHIGDPRSSLTLCTIELITDGAGARLILTDQSAYLDGLESPEDREGGWGAALDNLEAYVGGSDAAG